MSKTIEGTILRETDKAICLKLSPKHEPFPDGEENTWFPLSQVEEIHRRKEDDTRGYDSIVITDWLARMKDL